MAGNLAAALQIGDRYDASLRQGIREGHIEFQIDNAVSCDDISRGQCFLSRLAVTVRHPHTVWAGPGSVLSTEPWRA